MISNSKLYNTKKHSSLEILIVPVNQKTPNKGCRLRKCTCNTLWTECREHGKSNGRRECREQG